MVVPLIGYVDRFSARPGEAIAVKVSSQLDRPYQADLVRIIHGDANPAGPGFKFEEVAAAFAGTYPSRFQPVHSGLVRVGDADGAASLAGCVSRSSVRVQPWLLDGGPQIVLAIEGGLTLSVAAEGASLEVGGAMPGRSADARAALVRVADRRDAGRLQLRQTALQRSWGVAIAAKRTWPAKSARSAEWSSARGSAKPSGPHHPAPRLL